MYRNIPETLRSKAHFCNWRYENHGGKKLTKIPYCSLTGKKASVSDRSTWCTFEQAVEASHYYDGIGYIFDKDSGIVGIDLDDPSGFENAEEVAARHAAIVAAFPGYWEISPSGTGLHGFVYGQVPSGRRREAVEIYSSGRYFTMTGAVYINQPIQDHHHNINLLWAELGGEKKVEPVNAIDQPEINTDYEILTFASTAVNGIKFIELFEGRFEQYYESQSEADFALCNVIAFYTQNKAQIARIFRSSALGQRKKAMRDDYLFNERYGIITRAFDRQTPPLDLNALRSNLEIQLQQQAAVKQQATTVNLVGGMPLPPQHSPMPMQDQQELAQAVNDRQLRQESAVKTPKPSTKHLTSHIYKDSNIAKSEYTMPPGLMGEIANFIYQAAPRPVPEIAIAGAIGMMSGICGRSYNVSGTGINTYTFLIAKTGRGKEAMQRGITKLLAAAVKTVPAATTFMGPSKIASPEALTKYISKTSQSFLSIMGEFADTLKKMSNVSGNPAQQGVRVAMLDLYNKSGQGDISGSLIYSDKDKNTDVITAPAFSVLGEATPEKFYELMSKEMIDEGLLPRCTIIEYIGKREQLNKHHDKVVPSQQLIDQLSALCAYSLQLNNGNNVIQVQTDNDAQLMFDDFDKYCDDKINAGDSMSAELWNRAHIKTLKLAALLAVGVNYINPVINAECATWALRLINKDVNNMLSKFEDGEVGVANVQNEQTVEIKKAFKKYVNSTWEEVAKMTGSSLQTHALKIVPHSFISGFCRQRTCFKNDRLGPVNGIKVAIQALIDCGEIVELTVIDKRKAALSGTARLYMVSDMKL